MSTRGSTVLRRLFTHILHPVFHTLCIVMTKQNLFKVSTQEINSVLANLYLAVTPSTTSNVTNNKNEPFKKSVIGYQETSAENPY